MKIINFSLRETHRYEPGWAHLDSYVPFGQVKILPRRRTEAGNGYDDAGSFVTTAVVCKPPADKQEARLIAQALADTLSGSHCQHVYDCCGCASTHSRVKWRGGRQFTVFQSVTRNY